MWVLLEGDAFSPQVTPSSRGSAGKQGLQERWVPGSGSQDSCPHLPPRPGFEALSYYTSCSSTWSTIPKHSAWAEHSCWRQKVAGEERCCRHRNEGAGPMEDCSDKWQQQYLHCPSLGPKRSPSAPKAQPWRPWASPDPLPSPAPHARGLPVPLQCCSAARPRTGSCHRLMSPPRLHIHEQPRPTVSSSCKAGMFTGSNFKLCP